MTAVLATKLFEPRVPRALVARPRLVKRFNDGLAARVTLVSAPAGYGKSSLLSEWRATPEGAATRLAWLSVDEADSDPVRFWAHVVAALQQADPGLGRGLAESLQGPGPFSLQPQLEQLVNELAALGEPLVLALDDLHAVSGGDVLQSLAFLVAHLPPQVRVVIASRTDPPLPLATLRARGDLSELRLPDLRFTDDELDAYFDGLGIVLDDTSRLTLGARTEGWAAGIHLAALSLAEVGDRAGFVRRFAGDDRAIVDYLADEVLARQPDDVQDFLLSTSVLDRMCAPLCDAVTGRAGGQSMLRAVEDANLFLLALDSTRTWFRYHHLFSELLRRELNARDADGEARLRVRAARWLADHGLIEEAVLQAVAGGAWDLALDLGTGHGTEMVSEGHSLALRQLFNAPADKVRGRPAATLGAAWTAALGGDLDAARRRLGDFDAEVGDAPPPTGTRIDADLLRALLADRSGDIDGCLVWVDRALTSLATGGEGRGLEHDARHGRALVFRARAVLFREGPRAVGPVLAEVFAVHAERRPTRGTIEALGLRALLAVWDGRPDDARRDAEEALALEAERRLEGTPHGAWPRLALGLDHLERLELADAEAWLATALDLLLTHRDVNGVAIARAALADRTRLAGEPHAASSMAQAILDERRVTAPALPPLLVHWLARSVEQSQLALGEIDVDALTTTGHGAFDRRRDQVQAAALAALAADRAGERERAAHHLNDALALAAAARWAAPFVELGAPLRELLTARPADADPAVADLRRRVLTALGRPPARATTTAVLVEQLSQRELAVLRRLPSSLSNQEIAGLLYVSLNTVKTQIQSIYRKLGVNSRHEAIERARQLDLL